MRSSTFLTLLGATLTVATPLAHQHLHKKAIVYDIVTDIVYTTVTESDDPPPTTVHVEHTIYVNPVEATSSSSSSTEVTSTSSEPTSTYVPPPPRTTSTTPAPAPPTTEAPAKTTFPAPVVEVAAPTSSPAPVAAPPAAPPAASSAAPVATSTPDSSDPLSSTGISNHNTCRSAHSAQDVTWNSTLADAAQKLASSCIWGHDLTIDGGGYGQNIASQGSSSSDAWTLESALENAIISEWYSEASLFTSLYGQESPSESGGEWAHFTQIVWQNSLEIGCAVAACPTSNSIFPGMYTWYTVCNYYPQGNILGEFAQNVAAS